MSDKRRSGISVARLVRERRGEFARYTATQAKNEFGRVLETALKGGRVVITKHNAPKAILISVDEFDRLSRATEVAVDTLSEEFDALLARMQTAKARGAMDAAFAASPKEMGKAAMVAARKRS
jgi:antitoxin Phd